MNDEMGKKVIVVGAGSSGLMAAGTAAENGAEVQIIEWQQRVARKLMITGKGRCNLTNDTDINGLLSAVPSNGRFLYSAFSAFSAKDTMAFFEGLGIPLKTERGSRVFPKSDKAVEIVDALLKFAERNGAKRVQDRVKSLIIEEDRVCGVRLQSGSELLADSVIIATGGKSYPMTGSTGDGYYLARQVGHNVTELLRMYGRRLDKLLLRGDFS